MDQGASGQTLTSSMYILWLFLILAVYTSLSYTSSSLRLSSCSREQSPIVDFVSSPTLRLAVEDSSVPNFVHCILREMNL